MRSFRCALEPKAEAFFRSVKDCPIGTEFEAIACATRHKSGRATVGSGFESQRGVSQNPKSVRGRARHEGATSQTSEANPKAEFHVETNAGNDVRAHEQVNGNVRSLRVYPVNGYK